MITTVTARLVYGFKIPDGLDNCDIDAFACRFENRDNVGTFSHGRGDTFGYYLGIKLLESDADGEAQVATIGLDAAKEILTAEAILKRLWESMVLEQVIPQTDIPPRAVHLLAERA